MNKNLIQTLSLTLVTLLTACQSPTNSAESSIDNSESGQTTKANLEAMRKATPQVLKTVIKDTSDTKSNKVPSHSDDFNLLNLEYQTSPEALATDSQFYANAHGVSLKEAMTRMILQHRRMDDNNTDLVKLKKEFGNRIVGSFKDNNSEEYAFAFYLKADDKGGNMPADRVINAPAMELDKTEKQVLLAELAKFKPDDIISKNGQKTLTRADIETAITLIENPLKLTIKFIKAPDTATTDEAMRAHLEKHKEALSKFDAISGSSLNSITGVYTYYVNEEEAQKELGMTVQQVGEEIAKILEAPVKVEVMATITTRGLVK